MPKSAASRSFVEELAARAAAVMGEAYAVFAGPSIQGLGQCYGNCPLSVYAGPADDILVIYDPEV